MWKNNERGSSLIFVVSLAIIFNIVLLSVYFTVTHTQKVSGQKKVKTSALSIAEAGKERLYGEITYQVFKPQANTRLTPYTAVPLKNGSFTVSCSSNTSLDTIWVESWGKDVSSQLGINVIAALTPNIKFSGIPIRGAVTARTNVDVLGNITIDGRDHDTLNAVVGAGVFGVSTCDLMTISGSAQIGGNGIAPLESKAIVPVRTTIVEEEVPVPASLASPEAFLGLPAGALDEYKSTTVKAPFHGIQYITNTAGPVDFGNFSSGIFIVHNTAKTAELHLNQGTFKGLIIVDRMAKINGKASVLGAVVALGDTDVSTFGNGGAIINYSSYVLNNLDKYCDNLRKRVSEVSWKEMKK